MVPRKSCGLLLPALAGELLASLTYCHHCPSVLGMRYEIRVSDSLLLSLTWRPSGGRTWFAPDRPRTRTSFPEGESLHLSPQALPLGPSRSLGWLRDRETPGKFPEAKLEVTRYGFQGRYLLDSGGLKSFSELPERVRPRHLN